VRAAARSGARLWRKACSTSEIAELDRRENVKMSLRYPEAGLTHNGPEQFAVEAGSVLV
jgi:hypothetical protein